MLVAIVNVEVNAIWFISVQCPNKLAPRLLAEGKEGS